MKHLVIVSFLLASLLVNGQDSTKMKKINGGIFVPLYGSTPEGVFVPDFYMDEHPVTNHQYLDFVKKNPKWKRSEALRIFADKSYLKKWKNDSTLGLELLPKSPVTNVSWFAAKAYCACQEKRLPTIDEWEFVAMASSNAPNAQKDSAFNHQIVKGYEIPKTYKNEIESTFKNYWGVWDMHGLVWEWSSDFNSVLISGESRQDVDTERQLFCGSAAINASNLMDYAAFMRYAFRGSLKARYCIQTLGFRCSKSIKK